MTKNEFGGLIVGDRVLCHINQTTYKVVGVDNSRTLGPVIDLESPDGYYRFATRGDALREFQLVNGQED